MERAVEAEHALAPEMPLCIIPATKQETQAVMLPGRNVPGITLQLSNAVFTMAFPMDPEQTQQHIQDCQRALLEARAVSMAGPDGAD